MERRILELLSKQLLITKGELTVQLNRERHNGSDISIHRLREMGYIDKVESLGTCLVITQKGMRALNEM
ncbi:MAG: hypothetical protein JSW41_02180 [Candidatus Aenigmatarchaeota archaeon]|nr:MAG: hypothetical protein JSW41_02180 [Candidatus Aenigmarchaeota archaeon]